LNVGFILYIAAASALGHAANPRLVYLALLFAICSSPLLFLRRGNDRFALYTIFLVIYFVSYGALDLASLTSPGVSSGEPSAAMILCEWLILLGGACFCAGYLLVAARSESSDFAAEDWPPGTLVLVGLLLWAAGTYASWFWTVELTVRAGEFDNSSSEGAVTVLMLGRYAQPLGVLVLAYAYTILRSILMTVLMVAIAAFQVVLGFMSDTKGGAMMAGIMVIVTVFLVHGKLAKAWAIAGLAFIFVAFPIFQAHRTIVVGEHGLSNAATAQNLGKALELSIEGQQRAAAEHAESFFERSSVKSAVEMIFRGTQDGVPFQHGYTLIPLLTIFIPRLIWPDKPDVQTGLLVDKMFHVTGTGGEVYISPSHLGELYWNFGWGGGLAGMLLLGLLLGWINRRCEMTERRSVTRLLILAITVYQTGVRFEGSIASEYAVWIRSVVGILIMHRLFARRARPQAVAAPARAADEAAPAALAALPTLGTPKFPNLLR